MSRTRNIVECRVQSAKCRGNALALVHSTLYTLHYTLMAREAFPCK